MLNRHFRDLAATLSARILLAALLCGTAVTPSLAEARFTCRAGSWQTCRFVVLHAGARSLLALRGGQSAAVPEAVVDQDTYMMTVNIAPPKSEQSCSRTPAPGRRSAWCERSTVRPLND
jgi:hypothetical protein